jgi:caspase domain-containing protein
VICRALALAVVIVCVPVASAAANARYAVVIGVNAGDANETILRYAEADARRVAETMRNVGSFLPENIVVLTAVKGDDVRRAMIDLNARLRDRGEGSMLFVFYSGHADAEALHLGGTRLSLDEIQNLTVGSPAQTRVLVVDSCRSGALTRVKGGKQGPTFEIRTTPPAAASGFAILTSSAAGEDAQESDQLQASVFTHHLVSGLLGAADDNRDGRISIDEAFGYASGRTLAATALSLPGPQHPTYRLDVRGRADVWLTEPGARTGSRGVLSFPSQGTYLVQSGGFDGSIVAELSADGPGGTLTVDAGRYSVSERTPQYLRQGTFVVAARGTTAVRLEEMRRVDYARVVRKGATELTRSWSAFALVGVRGDLLDLGSAAGARLGARLDLRPLSLELSLGANRADRANSRLDIVSYETALSVTGLHVFDMPRWSLGLGLEVGGAWLAQRFSDPGTRDRDAFAGLIAPVLQVEVPIGRRVYARAEGAFLTYLLLTERASGASTLTSYRMGAGAGVYY